MKNYSMDFRVIQEFVVIRKARPRPTMKMKNWFGQRITPILPIYLVAVADIKKTASQSMVILL